MSNETNAPENPVEAIIKNETYGKIGHIGDRYLRNRPFLVINTTARPASHVRTHKTGWSEDGKNWNVFEQVSVVDSISDKNLRGATIIIDVLNNKVVKNRFSENADEESVLKHFMGKYSDQIMQGLDIWARQNRKVPGVKTIGETVDEALGKED